MKTIRELTSEVLAAIMKLLNFVLIIFVTRSVTAIPLNRNKGSNDEDWQLIPDTYGNLHLVDIRNSDIEIGPSFNALNDVVFRLFTRSNPTSSQIITINNADQLRNSNFNPNHQTRFQIHGWNGGGHEGTGAAVRNAFINRGDFNVFTVDWGAGAGTPNYVLARNRVNETGLVVAQYVDFLNAHGLPYSSVGINGHSLGAHVAGAAGKRTRSPVASIAGLDPAGPLFSLDLPADRLHHTDANYVESIVTDAGRLGFEHPIAHANYYPNWGTSQPGCGTDFTGQCSHSRASELYVESINPANIFGAIRCRGLSDIRENNCTESGPSRRMGGEPLNDAPSVIGSVYFLTTLDARPFAQGPR